MTTNKEEKGYELETSEFLSPSLFCNAPKNTLIERIKKVTYSQQSKNSKEYLGTWSEKNQKNDEICNILAYRNIKNRPVWNF